jgi:hypothetical protein
MKAKELLKWIVNNDVCTDSMGTVEVDEDFDFNGYFGYEPAMVKVPEGEYLYIYTDSVYDVDLEKMGEVPEEDFVGILTDGVDKRNGGVAMIYLIKLED